MMGLALALGRDRAHDCAYELCRKAANERTPLSDLLQCSREISDKLGAATNAALKDPTNDLGLAGAMTDRVLHAG